MDTERFEEAIRLRDSGRLEEALKELAALTASTPSREEKASLHLNQSRCYRLLGRIAEARRELSSARQMAPNTYLVLYIEFEDATLYWHESDQEKALELLNRVEADYSPLLQMPEHRELYQQTRSSRGMLLTELERYQEAQPLLDESLSFDPHVVEMEVVLLDLGLCLLMLGRPEAAEAKFEASLRQSAEGASAGMSHYYLGTIFFKRCAFARALSEFKASLLSAGEAQIPERHIYSYLASSARALGMSADAEHYARVAEG